MIMKEFMIKAKFRIRPTGLHKFMWPQTLPPACLPACETATSNRCAEQEVAKWALSHKPVGEKEESSFFDILGVPVGTTGDLAVPLLPPHGWARGRLCF